MLEIGLVDDSVILRSAIKNVLESSGYQVVLEAGGSKELFEKLEGTVPDLMLLDVFSRRKTAWICWRGLKSSIRV